MLPSTRALASDLGLARGTVVEAYAQLQAEGYLTARRGSGTRVAKIPVSTREAAGRLAARAEPDRRARPPRFSFHPGLPDLTAFPYSAWTGALRRGLRGTPASTLGYGDPRGRSDLREALASYLARVRGVVADPELIVVCGGFSHGLALLSRALQARGDSRIAMEDPCVTMHRSMVATAGMAVAPLPVDELGARTDLLAPRKVAAVLLAPAHQFPLGVVLHPDRRASAIAWARAADGLIVEDDYDAELRYDGQPVGALQALDPEHVAYGATASKTLAPGLRLGWFVVPPALIDAVLELRDAEDRHVPATDQIALAELLRSGAYERHVRRMRARYRRRRERLLVLLAERAPEVRPLGIAAGLRVLLALPPGGPSADDLARRAAARSIELFPLSQFHHDGEPSDPDGVVLGYGALPEYDVEAGLAALGDLLAESM
jgi:GntR family transcriptional regulator/MocR family aminotransferase